MAITMVDMTKMRRVSFELEDVYTAVMKQLDKLDGSMSELSQLWQGEGAQAYQNAYKQNTANFLQFAEAIQSCSSSLTTITDAYGKADDAAAEAVKSMMGGKR